MGSGIKIGLNWQDAVKQAELAGFSFSFPVYQKIKHIEQYILSKEGGNSVNQ